jgi:hypothetical protein
LKQSSTAQPLVFLMIDSSDHITGKTGLTPTVTLSKSGAAFASPAGSVTEIANGWYKVAGNATDTGTLGPLILHATGTGADPVDIEFEVVAFDPQVGTNLGLSAIPTGNPGAANGLFIAGTNADTTVNGTFNCITFAMSNFVLDGTGAGAPGGIALTGSQMDLVDTPNANALTAISQSTRTELTVELARIDVATSTRMATFSLPANFSTLNITAAGKISEVVLTDTLTTYTGNTPQTGDSYTRLGAPAHASVSADIAAIAAAQPFTFTGANAVTITVEDATPTLLSSASVRITQGANTQPKQTNSSGIASFSLDDGSYTISITKGGYTFTPVTISVDATHVAFTKVMTAQSVPVPAAGQCTGTMVVLDENGAPEVGVAIQMRAVGPNGGTGHALDNATTTHTSNGSGYVTRLFPSGGAWYEWRRGTDGQWNRFQTATNDGDAFEIISGAGTP